jgi:hypothetical protein
MGTIVTILITGACGNIENSSSRRMRFETVEINSGSLFFAKGWQIMQAEECLSTF